MAMAAGALQQHRRAHAVRDRQKHQPRDDGSFEADVRARSGKEL